MTTPSYNDSAIKGEQLLKTLTEVAKDLKNHTHATLVDHNDPTKSVALSWATSFNTTVDPDATTGQTPTSTSSKYLVFVYLDAGQPVFKEVAAGNVKVGDSDKVDGYHIKVTQTPGTDTNTIYFV